MQAGPILFWVLLLWGGGAALGIPVGWWMRGRRNKCRK